MSTDRDDAAVLTEIRQEKRHAREAGDENRLGELEEMTAALLTASGDERRATQALERAIEHRTRAGDPQVVAKTRYGLALLDARVPGRANRARRGFDEALAGFRDAGDHAMAGRTLLRLAGLDISAQRFADAATTCRAAAGEYAAADLPADEVEALRLGAYAAQLSGDVAGALGFLSAAADAVPTADAALALRLDYSALGLAAPNGQELDEMLQAVGDGPARALVLLLRSAESATAGALDQARADAEEARQIALRRPDPVIYLQACLHLAGIAELAGDRTAQLTILFTCQASLADLLGDRAREPVLRVIHSLRLQWGDDEFEREMVVYRSQFEGRQR